MCWAGINLTQPKMTLYMTLLLLFAAYVVNVYMPYFWADVIV